MYGAMDERAPLQSNAASTNQMTGRAGRSFRPYESRDSSRSGGMNGQTPESASNAGDEVTDYASLLESLSGAERDTGERLRRHLQFFFMDPMMKWKVRRQFPFKLALQVLKIVFITAQLVLFAEMRMSHVHFMEDTNTVMRHKFLKEWGDDRDTNVYPPNQGQYSVYTASEIFQHLAYIIDSYYSIHTDLFASFSYDVPTLREMRERVERSTSFDPTPLTPPTEDGIEGDEPPNVSEEEDLLGDHIAFDKIPPITMCLDRIANVSVQNATYYFDVRDVYECISMNFTQAEVKEIRNDSTKVEEAFRRRNITFKAEDALIVSKATVRFNLRTIHFSPLTNDQEPECYLIEVWIAFDNSRHTGQVPILLSTVISYVNVCNGRIITKLGIPANRVLMGIVDVSVLFMCLASFVLCARALIKAHLLEHKAVDYFAMVLKRPLSVSDRLDFLNMWYVMIVANDVCIIVGTVCKISIEFRHNYFHFRAGDLAGLDFDSDLFTLTGILLGIGALLVYVGVLRYFGFFSQYNILILTMKKSLPNILRFMSCAAVLYAGFLIAGWVIIGPYSMKFRTLAASSEALFSLLNGDDMFATFFTINDSNTVIKVFGTVYIYVFVSLFIYVVLSLFIAIIMDAYEIVKDRYNEGLFTERSHLKDFLASAPVPVDRLNSPSTRDAFAPSALLNLVAGNDSRPSRALQAIDRFRDYLFRTRHPNFESFHNPLDDNVEIRTTRPPSNGAAPTVNVQLAPTNL